jgi:hypothetical protein
VREQSGGSASAECCESVRRFGRGAELEPVEGPDSPAAPLAPDQRNG